MSSSNNHRPESLYRPAKEASGKATYGDFDVGQYTKTCQDVAGPKADGRAKYLLDHLMKHLHQFAAETDLTLDEWKLSCDLLVRSGQMSDDKRNEMILISDVLGIESLLDNLAFERVKASGGDQSAATETAVLGPFFRTGAPRLGYGGDIVQDHSLKNQKGQLGTTAYISGTVKNVQGEPLAGAEIDVWHTAPNGFYEQQDPEHPDYNNRGVLTTDAQGKFAFRCLKPTAYPIPFDGGAGDILRSLDRSPMRPAHIHFWVRAQGYNSLITQIFDSGCEYLGKDAVFADKTALTVDFVTPFTKEGKASGTETEVQYDVVLAKKAQ
ncbi:unnamed protein product [Sympodiomycopsis kandeliae]